MSDTLIAEQSSETKGGKPAVASKRRTKPPADRAIRIDRKMAISGLKASLSVIERRNAIPVLGAVRVVPACGAKDGHVVLYATNLDETIRVTLPVASPDDQRPNGAPFHISDPAGLVAALSAAGGADVEIEGHAGAYVAQCGALTRESTMAYDDDDPVHLPAFVAEPALVITFGAAVLKRLALLRSAISTEQTRYYLNGIFMHRIDEWTWRFVATDGHRLITLDVPLPGAIGDMPDNPAKSVGPNGIILPRSWIMPALSLFERSDAALTMAIGFNQRQIDQIAATKAEPAQWDKKMMARPVACVMLSGHVAGNRELTVDLVGKSIDGTYPDYSRVIPKEFNGQALMGIRDLRQAILAVAAGASRRCMPAMKMRFGDGTAELQVDLIDQSIVSSFTFACEHTTPAGFAIGFKPSYIIDLLAIFSGEQVLFRFTDNAGPCVISDPADPELTAVLMPMRF